MDSVDQVPVSSDRRSDARSFLRWLLLIPLILLFTSCCATLATIARPLSPEIDTASRLVADYAPWVEVAFAAVDPSILDEIAHDLGWSGTPGALPPGGCFLAGPGCPTGTPTPTPTTAPVTTGTPGTPAATATVLGTPTRTATAVTVVASPTATLVPPPANTPTRTPTPLVYPVKLANPVNIPPGVGRVEFTILVINYGNPTGAQLTDVIDTLPSGMAVDTASCIPACAGGGTNVHWSVSVNIPQGGFQRFSFQADYAGVAAGEVLTNMVETRGGNFLPAVNIRRVYAYTPTPVGTTPIASNDSYSLVEDNTLNVPAPGVLGNDSDPSGDPLRAVLTGGPSHASPFSLNPNGSFSYTPAANYYGADAFTYQACDPGIDGIVGNGDDLCDPATVSLNITPVEENPVAVDDAYTLFEDTGAVHAVGTGVRANDYDPDDLTPPASDTLTISLITPPGHQDPAHPFTLNPDGSFGYWSSANWSGAESFVYRACDPTLRCDTATAALTVLAVNDAPVAVNDSATTNEDTFVDIPVVVNDTDVDTPNGALTIAAGSILNVHGGTAVLADARTVRFTPSANANDGNTPGGFGFQYRTFDGTSNSLNVGVVTVSVPAVNDRPTAVDDPLYTTGVGVALNVTAPGVLVNDTDIDGPLPLSAVYAIASGPANGTLSCPTNPSLTICADGSFEYTPSLAFHDVDTFQYLACDAGADGIPANGDDLCSAAPATVTITVNDPPVAVADAAATAEDTPISGNVLTNDTDPNFDPLTAALFGGAVNGSVALAADGSFTFTPNANANDGNTPGGFSFQYRASDGWTFSNVATVTISVSAVNDPPVAANDSATTPINTPVLIAVLTNDSDVDGDPLSIGAVSAPSHGTAVTVGNQIRYTPNAGYLGTDSFTYEACDPAPLCDTATVQVFVNGSPTAVDDNYTVQEDTVRNVAAPGVLGNDTDPNGDPLQAFVLVGPLHEASFTLNLDGSFSYRPLPNYDSTDQFTYRACDPGGECDSATVFLTIVGANDPPVAIDDTKSTSEDTSVDVFVLANDSDPDTGDGITLIAVTDPPNGNALIDDNGTPGDPTDDFIVYAPDLDFVGSDSFDYTIEDATGLTDTATVDLTVTGVNDAPHAHDDAYLTPVDTLLVRAIPGVLGNDVEPEGEGMRSYLVAPPTSGTLLVFGTFGNFEYMPNPGYHGIDTFIYQACDPGPDLIPGNADDRCDPATVTIRVDEPPIALDDGVYSATEDGALNVGAPGVLANDTDPEGDSLEARPLSTGGDPLHGSVTINLDGSFDYTPDPDYSGDDSFDYRACDPYNVCDVATVSITVLGVNDAPVAVDDPEAPAVYRASSDGSTLTVAAPGVLGNDTDVDTGDTLTAVLDSGTSAGSLTLNPDGSFSYAPTVGSFGSDSFTYHAQDAAGAPSNVATVTILINAAPIAVDDASFPAVNEDDPAGLVVAAPGVLGNDSDPNLDPLTASLVSGTSGLTLHADGSFIYHPPANFNGTATFTYQACDLWLLCSAPATVQLTVTPVNDAPTALDDAGRVNVGAVLTLDARANDSDIDGDTVWLNTVADPAHGTAVIDIGGTPGDPSDDRVIYTPDGVAGDDVFTYTIRDDLGGFGTGTITVTVNGPPSIANDVYSITEDTLRDVPVPGVVGNDSDPNGDTLAAILVAGPTEMAPGGFSWGGDGSFSYLSRANYFGGDSFSYRVCDSGADQIPGNGDDLCSAGNATVTLTISPVNDPPVAGDDGGYPAIDEDDPAGLTVAAPGVLANDSDPVEGSPVTAATASDPPHGSVTLNADGSFVYHPDANFFGSDTFTYQAFDGSDYSAAATVTVVVNSVNDPPVAVNDSASTNQGTPVTINVVANDTDIDGSVVAGTTTLVSGPASGTVVNDGGGSFTYTPDPLAYGSDSFTYYVFDNDAAVSNEATVTVHINPPVLRVVKEADHDPAMVGETVTFLIYIWNDGPGTAYGLSLSDTIGTCFGGGTIASSLGDLGQGGAIVFPVPVTVVSGTSCSNTNSVTVSSLNVAPVSDTVSVTILP